LLEVGRRAPARCTAACGRRRTGAVRDGLDTLAVRATVGGSTRQLAWSTTWMCTHRYVQQLLEVGRFSQTRCAAAVVGDDGPERVTTEWRHQQGVRQSGDQRMGWHGRSHECACIGARSGCSRLDGVRRRDATPTATRVNGRREVRRIGDLHMAAGDQRDG